MFFSAATVRHNGIHFFTGPHQTTVIGLPLKKGYLGCLLLQTRFRLQSICPLFLLLVSCNGDYGLHLCTVCHWDMCVLGGLLCCWCWWGRIPWNFVSMCPALCWEAQILAFPSHTLGQAHCCIVHASGWGDQALASGAGMAQEDYAQGKQNRYPCYLRHNVPLTCHLCSVFSPWPW